MTRKVVDCTNILEGSKDFFNANDDIKNEDMGHKHQLSNASMISKQPPEEEKKSKRKDVKDTMNLDMSNSVIKIYFLTQSYNNLDNLSIP